MSGEPQSIRIADFHGFQVDRFEAAYPATNQQYATSSYQTQHDMNPLLIARPTNEADVVTAVNWAREKKVAVAIKSGGHQYSGASSTGGPNIQIDLTDSFKEFKVLEPTDPVAADRALVFIGVSVTMAELIGHLNTNKLFVPTGQCATVGVGGHGQTGGYGMLGRSFGLLGDCIRIVRLIGDNGQSQDVSKESDPELFYAILGGSPGNFGVITHFIVEVFKSDSYLGTTPGPGGYKGPHAIKAMFIYTRKTLVTLLASVAKMADDVTFPRGFDLCVTVYSQDSATSERFNLLKDPEEWKRAQTKISHVFADKPAYLRSLSGEVPPAVILYAQWCPTSQADKYDARVDGWFKTFRELNESLGEQSLAFFESDVDMANMAGLWLMNKAREFELPYVKRTYSTASKTLTTAKWAETVADRIDLIYNPKYFFEGRAEGEESERYNRCKLAVQIQSFGGKESQFQVNKDNGTSYSWRDSTVVQTMDCFHNPDEKSKAYALAWQAGNDEVMIGPNSVFSTQDRRLLWGSWGDWNMSDVKIWSCYYENQEKYQRLGKARGKADPRGTFTANPFAVEAVKSSD